MKLQYTLPIPIPLFLPRAQDFNNILAPPSSSPGYSPLSLPATSVPGGSNANAMTAPANPYPRCATNGRTGDAGMECATSDTSYGGCPGDSPACLTPMQSVLM